MFFFYLLKKFLRRRTYIISSLIMNKQTDRKKPCQSPPLQLILKKKPIPKTKAVIEMAYEYRTATMHFLPFSFPCPCPHVNLTHIYKWIILLFILYKPNKQYY